MGKTLKNLEDVYGLTPLQEDILWHYINHQNQGFYHENLLFMFQGTVDVALFEKTWKEVVSRYTILRTGFFHKNLKKPLQVVNRKVDLSIDVLDWKYTDEEEKKKTLDSLIDKDRATDYDLTKAPLMRLTLILENNQQFKFWWRFHHILMDGWSFTIVLNDFLSLYRRDYLNEKVFLPQARPFKEYVLWLEKRDKTKEETFWKTYLENSKQENSLIQRPVDSNVIRQKRIDYDIEELYDTLEKIRKEKGITLNALFQGIFSLLVESYSRQSKEVTIGAMTADRPLGLPHSQTRVGLLVNTLPVKVTIEENMLFTEWIKELQSLLVSVFQYSSSSEKQINQWCSKDAHTSLFEYAIIFKNMPIPEDPFKGLDFTLFGYSLESRPYYPVSLFVWPHENMELKLIYDCKYMTEEQAYQLLDDMKQGLKTFISNPGIYVKDVLKQKVLV